MEEVMGFGLWVASCWLLVAGCWLRVKRLRMNGCQITITEHRTPTPSHLIQVILASVIGCTRLAAQDSVPLQNAHSNIVLIVSQGHGINDLGCYGNRQIKTPNLDYLATEGVRMTNAYGTTTSAGASQSVILTGMYNHATGQYGSMNGYSHFTMFPEIKGLPYYLKQGGYRTARIGEFAVKSDGFFSFDTLLGTGANYRNTYVMAEHCAGFISGKDEGAFFLYFCPSDPGRSNDDAEEPQERVNHFGNREEGYEGIIPTYYKYEKMTPPSYLPDLPVTRKEYAQYAQAISRMDLGIGRLFELLKKNGKWDKTLIIYLTATGPAFAGNPITLYEPAIHLPCIIKPSYNKAETRICDAMINWTDILPTILDFGGALPDEYSFHGQSFKFSLSEEHPRGKEETYASHTFEEITMYYPMRMVRNRRFKLIWNIAWPLMVTPPNDMQISPVWLEMNKEGNGLADSRHAKDWMQRPKYELYDESNDPKEIKNLASDPAYADVLAELKGKLKNFQVKTNDPWIICP
jgi:N-sulfoglucosamine sulfohydrolase